MKLPLNTDLTGKTVVITGAGGVLGGMFAKALAQAGGRKGCTFRPESGSSQESSKGDQRRGLYSKRLCGKCTAKRKPCSST